MSQDDSDLELTVDQASRLLQEQMEYFRDLDPSGMTPEQQAEVRAAAKRLLPLVNDVFTSTIVGELNAISSELKEALEFSKSSIARDNRDLFFRVLIQKLANISSLSKRVGQQLTVQGVNNNQISKKLASELMGVHQVTVARWVKDGLDAFPFLDDRPAEKLAADERIDDD